MTAETPDVTIVGAGMAGMTAALKLLEAGFTVRVIEASDGVGGKFGAVPAKHGRHDFAWHVFSDWFRNFWSIVETIGLSKTDDFAARPRLTLLRPLGGTSAWPRVTTIDSIGSPETFWSNASSGIAHWSDVMLFSYGQYTLLSDATLEREEFLNRVTVNGYMRSLPYMSDVAALLHNELLLRIWAIPSYLISARAYQTHLKLLAPLRASASRLLVLRKNFEDGFWRPFLATLNRFPGFTLVRRARLTGIRLASTRDRVDTIIVRHSGETGSRTEKVRSLVVAIPAGGLLEVLADPESLSLRQEVPGLLGLAKLTTRPTAALDLYFKRRVDMAGVDDEPVALVDDLESIYATEDLAPRNGLASEYGISFMNVARLWGTAHPTVLALLASEVDSLAPLGADEACRRIIAELHRYVEFDDRDIDWDYSHFQAHADAPLFVNSVGSWEYRPEVRLTNSDGTALGGQVWKTIRNLYLAGDYCRSQIDITSLEGAIHTGIWAAHALSRTQRAAGAVGVAEVPEPVRPFEVDYEQVREIRGRLERWAGLAARRSHLVKEGLLAAAAKRRQGRHPGPSAPRHLGTVSTGAPAGSDGGGTMHAPLSTYPAFATPSPTGGDPKWFQKYRRDTKSITLKSGAIVPIPFLFWDVQALCLEGHAEIDGVDLVLRDHGLRARPDDSGRARVRIWAPDYGGTSVGPHKAVYALIEVELRRSCDKSDNDDKRAPDETGRDDGTSPPEHWSWWWYYGNSPLNQEFRRDVWGIPNELASIQTSYLTPTKRVVRLVENGGVALQITCPWNAPRTPRRPDLSFRTVARRSHDDGENWVDVNIWGPVGDGPVEKPDDVLRLRKEGTIETQLRAVGFTPTRWSFYAGYQGIVKIYDERGSGKDPIRDTEDRYVVVRSGDAWVIREFEHKPS